MIAATAPTAATQNQAAYLAFLWNANRAMLGIAPKIEDVDVIVATLTKREASREIDSYIRANRSLRAAIKNGAIYRDGVCVSQGRTFRVSWGYDTEGA